MSSISVNPPPRYRLFIFGSVFLFTDTWTFCISVPLRLGYCTHFESWTWGGEGTLNVNIWHIESHVNGAWRRHLKGDRDAVCRTYKHVFPWLTLPQPFPLDNVTDLTEPFLPTRTVLMKGGGQRFKCLQHVLSSWTEPLGWHMQPFIVVMVVFMFLPWKTVTPRSWKHQFVVFLVNLLSKLKPKMFIVAFSHREMEK